MIFFVFLATLIVILIVQFVTHRLKSYRLRGELGLKGPSINFLTGSISEMYTYIKTYGVEQSMELSGYLHDTYGETFGFYNGPNLDIASRDPQFAKEVLVTQFGNFVDRQVMALNDTFPMAEGLLQVSGAGFHGGIGWKDMRSVVSPAFTSSKMRRMHNIIDERVRAFVGHLEDKVSKGEGAMEIYEEWQALTMDTIARSAFAAPCDSIHDRNETFYVNSIRFFNVFTLEQSPIPIILSYLLPAVAPHIRRFTRIGAAEKPLVAKLKKVVRERRANFESFPDTDLIQLLLEQDTERQKNENKPPLSDDVIVTNCFHFLLAGYETTSTALAFATWCLATHRDAQERLFEEVMDTFGEDGEIDYDRVMVLPWLDCVFRESLRLYPPVVLFTSRTCIKDTEVLGQRIPKGCTVTIPVHQIHWSEKNWENPKEFQPERFLDNEAKKRTEWMPFGLGPRNCVGMRFAEMEFKTALAAVCRKFGFTPQKPGTELKVRLSLVLQRPCDGVFVNVERRNK